VVEMVTVSCMHLIIWLTVFHCRIEGANAILIRFLSQGVPPWAGEYTNEFALMYNIASSTRLPDVPDYLSAECKSFLQLCFQRDAKVQ